MDHVCFLCLVFLMLSHLIIAALWLPAGKRLTSWLLLVFCYIPISILGQVWYLIVSFPDLCHLSFLDTLRARITLIDNFICCTAYLIYFSSVALTPILEIPENYLF